MGRQQLGPGPSQKVGTVCAAHACYFHPVRSSGYEAGASDYLQSVVGRTANIDPICPIF